MVENGEFVRFSETSPVAVLCKDQTIINRTQLSTPKKQSNWSKTQSNWSKTQSRT